jgi:hypothetical protein
LEEKAVMTDMIERVGTALDAILGEAVELVEYDRGIPAEAKNVRRKLISEAARAAILAMREMSPEMQRAVERFCEIHADAAHYPVVYKLNPWTIWSAGIDAALQEETELLEGK